MSGPTMDVLALIEKKPFLKRIIQSDCGGEWARVVAFPDDSYVVYNTPQKASQMRGKSGAMVRTILKPTGGKKQPPKKKAAPKQSTGPTPLVIRDRKVLARVPTLPTPQAHQEPPHEKVIDLRETPEPRTIKPGITVFQQPVEARESRQTWVPGTKEVDWSIIDLDASCTALLHRFRDGYPEELGFWYYKDVLAMNGLDFDGVEAALRHPDRVEIRPESYGGGKGYPVLGFYRGDVRVIVGFREPSRPMIIDTRFSIKTQPAARDGVTDGGGGGAKKDTGLPKTITQLRKRLAQAGAELTTAKDGKSFDVCYHGQHLRKVEETLTRQEITTVWQQLTRRMNGIEQKEAKTA